MPLIPRFLDTFGRKPQPFRDIISSSFRFISRILLDAWDLLHSIAGRKSKNQRRFSIDGVNNEVYNMNYINPTRANADEDWFSITTRRPVVTLSNTNDFQAPALQCTACLELKNRRSMMRTECGDCYCGPCLNELFKAATTDEASFPAKCHNVRIDIDTAWTFLTTEVATLYGMRMIEWGMTPARRTYCFKCAKFLPPTDWAVSNHIVISAVAELMCDECGIFTCTVCKEVKHEGKCERQQVKEVAQLAEELKWKSCPYCNEMIERIEGCNNMRCLCGARFCYKCGTPWKTCNCQYFDEPPPNGNAGLDAMLQGMNAHERLINGLGRDPLAGPQADPRPFQVQLQGLDQAREARLREWQQINRANEAQMRQNQQHLMNQVRHMQGRHPGPRPDQQGLAVQLQRLRQENQAFEYQVPQNHRDFANRPLVPQPDQRARNFQRQQELNQQALNTNRRQELLQQDAAFQNQWQRLRQHLDRLQANLPAGAQLCQQERNAQINAHMPPALRLNAGAMEELNRGLNRPRANRPANPQSEQQAPNVQFQQTLRQDNVVPRNKWQQLNQDFDGPRPNLPDGGLPRHQAHNVQSRPRGDLPADRQPDQQARIVQNQQQVHQNNVRLDPGLHEPKDLNWQLPRHAAAPQPNEKAPHVRYQQEVRGQMEQELNYLQPWRHQNLHNADLGANELHGVRLAQQQADREVEGRTQQHMQDVLERQRANIEEDGRAQ